MNPKNKIILITIIVIITLFISGCTKPLPFSQMLYNFLPKTIINRDLTLYINNFTIDSEYIDPQYQKLVDRTVLLLNNTKIHAQIKADVTNKIYDITALIEIDNADFLEVKIYYESDTVYISASEFYKGTFIFPIKDLKDYIYEIIPKFKENQSVADNILEAVTTLPNNYDEAKNLYDSLNIQEGSKETTTLCKKEITGINYMTTIDYKTINSSMIERYGYSIKDELEKLLIQIEDFNYDKDNVIDVDLISNYYINKNTINGAYCNFTFNLNSLQVLSKSNVILEITKDTPLDKGHTFTKPEDDNFIYPLKLTNDEYMDIKLDLSNGLTKLLTKSNTFQKFVGELIYY